MKKFHKKLKKYFKMLEEQAEHISEVYYDDEWELEDVKIEKDGVRFSYKRCYEKGAMSLFMPLDILDDAVLEKWLKDNGKELST